MKNLMRLMKLTALAALVALGLQVQTSETRRQAVDTPAPAIAPENLEDLLPAQGVCGMIVTQGVETPVDLCNRETVLRDI